MHKERFRIRLTANPRVAVAWTTGVITLIYVLALHLARLLYAKEEESRNGLGFFALLLGLLLPVISGIALPYLARRLWPKSASFNPYWLLSKRKVAKEAIFLTLAFILLNLISGIISRLCHLPWVDARDYKYISFWLWLLFAVMTCTLVPLSEELFFRGFLQDQFRKLFKSRIAVFSQAILFTLCHAFPMGPSLAVFLLGLAAGIYREKRQALLPIVLAHALLNTTRYGLILLKYFLVNQQSY